MYRKFIFLTFALCLTLLLGASTCLAGSFQKLYEVQHVTDTLRSDTAWSKTFNTMNGEIKLQIRKLAGSSSEKRYHLVVKLDKEDVYKLHLPEVEGGYSVAVLKDTSTSRQFYVLQSKERAYLFGYEQSSKKFEIYVDSQNYLNRYNGIPTIAVLKNGDLVLAFEPAYASVNAPNYRYSFFWDNRNSWFSYKDLGTGYGPVQREMS